MSEGVDMETVEAEIDAWAERTRALTGKVVREREPWNVEVSKDAVRHFAYGTDDDNPLWTDEAYARASEGGRLQAPPAFLVSSMYPILHGAPMKAPLASLIGGVEYEWFERIFVGDTLTPEPRQKDFYEKRNKQGRRLGFVISEITYRNQNGTVVGRATGTMIMATQVGTQVMLEHEIPHYGEARLEALETTWRTEARRGGERRRFADVEIGEALPPIVRGPLTIGDMVAWNAAIGPSYKGGRWGYLDLTKAPHTAMVNPVTGFPVKYSQQHEDFQLASGRGMPAPFDNGVMRFAWVAPLVTNWMGDHGFLRRLYVQVKRPGLYGDLVTYTATVTSKNEDESSITVSIAGGTEDGRVSTAGEAVVGLPA